MKRILFAATVVMGLGACATTNAPATAWGKKDVSMLDYRTDGGQCAVLAATASPGENGARTAGGINGSNASVPNDMGRSAQGGATGATAPSTGSAGTSSPLPTNGSIYRENASPDFVMRAATQQRTREMAEQRARVQMLKSCLTERGYTEFTLSSEQRAKLSKLAPGSDERREYLYKLGTDPEVLSKAAVKSDK